MPELILSICPIVGICVVVTERKSWHCQPGVDETFALSASSHFSDIVDGRELSEVVLRRKNKLKAPPTHVNRAECKRRRRIEPHRKRRMPLGGRLDRASIVQRFRGGRTSQQFATDVRPRAVHHDFAHQVGQTMGNDMDFRVESDSNIGVLKLGPVVNTIGMPLLEKS